MKYSRLSSFVANCDNPVCLFVSNALFVKVKLGANINSIRLVTVGGKKPGASADEEH